MICLKAHNRSVERSGFVKRSVRTPEYSFELCEQFLADCSSSPTSNLAGSSRATTPHHATPRYARRSPHLSIARYIGLREYEFLELIGRVGHPGEMFTSAAPQDPVFWPLHGLGERRLVRLARLARTAVALLSQWFGRPRTPPDATPLSTSLPPGERLVQLLRLMDAWGDLTLDEVICHHCEDAPSHTDGSRLSSPPLSATRRRTTTPNSRSPPLCSYDGKTWGYAHHDALSWNRRVVCDWSAVGPSGAALPNCTRNATCPGHGEGDVLPFEVRWNDGASHPDPPPLEQ